MHFTPKKCKTYRYFCEFESTLKINFMDSLFTPVTINHTTIQNRFMRSATFMHACDSNGFPKPELLKYYKNLADGKMGLIVPGYFHVQKAGKAVPGQGGLATDQQAEAWRYIVKYVHDQGSKMMFQLADGRFIKKGLIFRRYLSEMEISEIIDNFRLAAKRVQNIGGDGIQIHAAHGYLISQFLSPYTNKRQDRYGGSPENRRRILVELADAIRKECGKEFLIAVKYNGSDCLEGGFTPNDAAETAAAIKDVDLWEVSCGMLDPRLTSRFNSKWLTKKGYEKKIGYNLDYVPTIRAKTDAKIAVCGGLRSKGSIIKSIKQGADLVSMSRAAIADTHVVKHLMEGQNIKCIGCNKCFTHMIFGSVKCYVYK